MLRTSGGGTKSIGPIDMSGPKVKYGSQEQRTLGAHETGEQQAISGGGETDAAVVAQVQLMEWRTRIHEVLTNVIGGLRCGEGKT